MSKGSYFSSGSAHNRNFLADHQEGVRVDDVVLLAFSLILFWAHFGLQKKLYDIEWWVLGLTAFSFVSFGMNRIFSDLELIHVDSKIFYCVRILEYFLFFYIGAMATRFAAFKVSNVVWAFFLVNMVLIFLQKGGLMGTWTAWGFAQDSTYRAAGIASFPSEMGALLDIMFCFLIFDKSQKPKILNVIPRAIRRFMEASFTYWMFLLFVVLVIFTGSRIAILALLPPFFIKLKGEISLRKISTLMIAVPLLIAASIVMIFLISNSYAIAARSYGLISMSNFNLIVKVWDGIVLTHDPIGNESIAMGFGNKYDASWWMRIHKWCYALKIYVLHPHCWLQGVGPGFAMGALDGGFLRILTEYGLIGCYLFWRMFKIIYNMNIQLKWALIAFFINMIFFDAYLAYKPMILLFFMTGYAYAEKVNTESESRPLVALTTEFRRGAMCLKAFNIRS